MPRKTPNDDESESNNALDIQGSVIYYENSSEALQKSSHIYVPSNLASERAPLLLETPNVPSLNTVINVAQIDAKAFADKRGKRVVLWLARPLLAYIPDINVDQLADANDPDESVLKTLLIEALILAKYAFPTFFTLLQEHSVVLAPTVSLGHLSTTALAASTIANMVLNVVGHSVLHSFASALDIHLELNPTARTARELCFKTTLISAFALIPIIFLFVQSEKLLLTLNQTPEVAHLAGAFLRYSAFGLPAFACNGIMKRYLESQGQAHITTRVMILVAPLNIILNYILVDGPMPYAQGFLGAPLAMVISHSLITLLSLGALFCWSGRDGALLDEQQPHDSSPDDNSFVRGTLALVKGGIAGLAKTGSQVWSKDLLSLAVSMLGPTALASQAVLLATSTTAQQAPLALRNFSSTRVKRLLAPNRSDTRRATCAALVSLVATLLSVGIVSNVLLASAGSWGTLFNDDPLITAAVSRAIPTLLLFHAFDALGMWVDGMLDSLGKPATYPALIASADCFSGIPIGIYLAFPCKWDLSGIWIGLALSRAYSFVAAFVLLLRTKWLFQSQSIPVRLIPAESAVIFSVQGRTSDREVDGELRGGWSDGSGGGKK